ncbi:MAG: hypothetical protein HDR03_12945 [Lachnospiraceae bacterium]|nr:hypothetical protein [Lachnospiraceae bacterium]
MKRGKKKMSRIVSLLLAAAMIVTSLPQSMLTVNAAEVSDVSVSNEAFSEEGTQESGASENGITEGEASGDDSAKDGIAEGDSSGDNVVGEDSSEGNTSDGENPDNGTSNEGKLDGETSNEGKADDDAQGEDKTEGEDSEVGDTSSEDDGKDDAGQGEDEESQNGEEDGEEAGSVDYDIAEKPESEEPLLDEGEEKEPISISFVGNSESFTVYDESGNDITNNGFIVPYGSIDILKFKIMPKAETGYVVEFSDEPYLYTQCKWAGMEFSKTEVNGGGYECTISPVDKDTGYTQGIYIWMREANRETYKLKFLYSSEDVDELVLTNNPEGDKQNVSNNVTVRVINEYRTSFKLKAKAGKSLAVSYKSDDQDDYDRDAFKSYYVEDEDGYYNFDLGKVSENATITIQEGWKVNFEYNDDEIEELYRKILVGDEDDLLSGNAWFETCNIINHTEGVTKGEVLYFSFYPTEEYYLCDASVTDGLGNNIEKIWYGGDARDWAGGYVYKVVPTADMTINIEFTSKTLPVTYVDGVVKNISITAKDEGGEAKEVYDKDKKEIINIYSDMTEYNISFEVAEGKLFDRVELVNYYTWYDEETGEMQEEYDYEKIEVERKDDGTYASVYSFCIWSDSSELRIIADDAYTVTFVPSDEVKLYAYDDYELTNELSGEKNIVKDSEYEFRITFDTEYELATPYVIATSDGEERELKVIGDKYEMWDPSEEKLVYYYYCSFITTADTTISVSLKPLSIPLKYDKNALKNVEISEQRGAKLSADRDAVIANKYDELRDCEIMFGLEDGKTVKEAYYAYTRYHDTYTENIPMSYDEETQIYTITLNVPEVDDYRNMSIDYIQIVAGDKCEISFEGYEGKAEIIDFNNYEDINFDNDKPVGVVKNSEYLFRVELLPDYNAALCRVTTEGGEELPVKYYSIKGESWEEIRNIQYYSFTPTTDTTIHIEISPLSIPIKYTDSAVESLTLTHNMGEVENAPELSADKKAVNVWRYETDLRFDLELESGRTLSRIFSRRSNVDDYGNKIDGYYEDDIPYQMVDDKYYFEVGIYYDDYGSNLLEIEIVTDKVNLRDCTVELDLDNDYWRYYVSYRAEEIKPGVTLKYEVEEGKPEIIDPNEYSVTYENNRNVGEAYVIIKAKEDSEACTGSIEAYFEIVKAQAPTIDPISISVDVNDIKENPDRELNLSNSVLVNTGLEQGVKPIWYIVDTGNEDYTPGDVLVDGTDPFIDSQSQYYWNEENKEEKVIWTHTLKYSIKDDVDEDSKSAMIVLIASFDNYEDAKIVIEISMAEKEEIILDGYSCTRNKTYDAKPYDYDYDNLYLVGENGLEREDSAEIMKELKNSIKFHYKGEEYTKDGYRSYDSYEAPVNVGNYTLTVELSEENKSYTATPYEVGNVRINRREIYIRAEALNLNVGDLLPDKYSYRITGDGLLEGDKISPEPTLLCDATDTETAKKYKIVVDTSDMDICNSDGESVRYYYSIDYYDNWLTISSVSKTEITLNHKTGTSLTKIYDGEAFDGISLIEAKNDETPIEDAIITVKYTGRGNTVYTESETAPVDAGTYTMKAKVASNDGQYKSEELSLDIEITKAEAPVLQEQGINLPPVTEDTLKTLDLTQYIPTGYEVTGYGTVNKTDSANMLTGTAQVDAQGVLSYTLKADINTGTAELTIPLEFKNHKDTTLTVKIMLTSKTLLTLSKAAGVDVNKEYDGNAYNIPAEAVTVSGMSQGTVAQPELDYTYTLRGSVEPITALHAGLYSVTVTVAEDDENYAAQSPLVIDFEITKKTVNVTAKSGNWNKAFVARPTATEYPLEYEQDSLIGSDSWTNGPTSYTYTYNVDGKETVLPDTDDAWEALEAGTVITVTPAGAKATDDYEVVHISGKLTVADMPEDGQMYVPDIEAMTYTGSQIKPQVKVYFIKNGEPVELTSKDYKVTYGENKDAGTGTVKITGKGNYDKEIEKTFTIEKASIGDGSENTALGITLKYTDQSLDTKASKLVTSLKYKKALKEGTDFTVTLTKADAPEGTAPVSKTEGTTPAKTPTGADKAGAYTLRIKPVDNSNYSGYIEKTVYIAGKDKLLKNAKITIKTKTLKWDDKDTTGYGNYNKDSWGGFYLIPGSSKDDAKDFTVSMGKTYLTNGQTGVNDKDADKSQYYISYTNNDQAGTATITVTGDGINYIGTKSATFKIQGTAFKAGTKAGNIKLPDTLTAPEAYTGKAITKDLSSLEIVGKTDGTKLSEGVDYSVTHSNNVKKGNATVIITAKPESGYTGSIKKTFKIQAADLKKAIKSASGGNAELKSGTDGSITGIEYKDPVSYSKAGATISGLVFKNETGTELKSGTDYTVKYTYTDKKDKKAGSSAKMTLKGKGNYSGTVDVEFTIGKAAYSNLEVSVAPVKLGNKALKPKVTVKDGKKALTVSEDGKKEVKVTYANNEPEKVQAWLTWLASGSAEETEPAAPTVTIEIVNNANYEQVLSDTRTLNVYSDKLDKNKLTINWRDTAKVTDFTYNNGEQIKPEISSINYDNKTYTVMAAGKDYYAYDSNNVEIFKIIYGANNKSGKKAGSVTIEGLKLYGGKYTEKFEIKPRDIVINN